MKIPSRRKKADKRGPVEDWAQDVEDELEEEQAQVAKAARNVTRKQKQKAAKASAKATTSTPPTPSVKAGKSKKRGGADTLRVKQAAKRPALNDFTFTAGPLPSTGAGAWTATNPAEYEKSWEGAWKIARSPARAV